MQIPRTWLAGLSALAAAAAVAAEPAEDILCFANGDRLRGRLLGIADGALRWQHPATAQAIKFTALDGLERIELGARGAPPAEQTAATIRLTNGDELPGVIATLDNQRLVLDTWYAGRVNFARQRVQAINFYPPPLYAGPTNLAEWTFDRPQGLPPAWEFKDGRLQTGAPGALMRPRANAVKLPRPFLPGGSELLAIGKPVSGGAPLPDSCEFRFEADWRSGLPDFSFLVYVATPDNSGDCYRLHINGTRLLLQRREVYLGAPAYHTALDSPRTNRASFCLRISRPNRSFHLLINGQPVNQWTDAAGLADGINGLGFRPEFNPAPGEYLGISGIRVAEWDNVPPEVIREKTARANLLRFTNRDMLSGNVLGIAGGVLRFQTDYATNSVPLGNLRAIVLAAGEAAGAQRGPDEIRAVFTGQGALTLRLVKIESDRLQAASDHGGPLSLALGAFRRLEFKPADPAAR